MRKEFGRRHAYGRLVTRLKASSNYPLNQYWLEPSKERNRHTKHTNKKINYRKMDEDGKIEQGQKLHVVLWSLRHECHGKSMAHSKTTNLRFILLKCTLNKQKIRETDTFMSPVTCFHQILSHDVCKPVMEAYEAACAVTRDQAFFFFFFASLFLRLERGKK